MIDQETHGADTPALAAVALPKPKASADLMRNGPPVVPTDNGHRNRFTATAIYDGLAVLYNGLPKGGMLVFRLPNKQSVGNLEKVIKGRGLEPEDFILIRARFDANGCRYPIKDRPMVIERLTDKPMRLRCREQSGIGRQVADNARRMSDELARNLLNARAPSPEQAEVLTARGGRAAPRRAGQELDEEEIQQLQDMEIPEPLPAL